MIEKLRNGDNWRKVLHPDPIYITNEGYNADDFFMDVDNAIDDEIKEQHADENEFAIGDVAYKIGRPMRDVDVREQRREELDRQKAIA